MLVLSLKSGDDFYVDDHRFVFTGTGAWCRLQGTDGAAITLLTAPAAAEIMPGVSASLVSPPGASRQRVSLEAPRSVPIDRGDLYRRCGGHPTRLKAP